MINIDESVSKGTCIDSCILYYIDEVELHLQQNRKSSVWLFLSQGWICSLSICIKPIWLLHVSFLPLDLLWLKNIPTWTWISGVSPIHSVSKLRENNHFTFAFTDRLKNTGRQSTECLAATSCSVGWISLSWILMGHRIQKLQLT